MKSLLVPLLAIFAFAGALQAQTGPISRTIPLNFPYGPLVAAGTACTPPGFLDSYTSGIVTYNFPTGAPNAVTLTLIDGRTGSTIDTGATTTGGSIAFPSVHPSLCITVTTMTGSGVTVQGVFQGISTLGAVTVDPTGLATGGKTNNNAIPGATNTGVLPCVANAAAPTDTETFQVACSVDLSGRTRLVAESGGIKSGAVASGAVASGAYASGSISNGANVVEGSTTDAKCLTTDATACTIDGLLKAVSANTASLVALAATDDCLGTIPTRKRYISVGSAEDESQVKATLGTLCSIEASNANASANAFIKCTNLTAANTTPGSSAIFYDIMVPFGLTVVDSHISLPFDTALTCYIVLGKTEAAVDEVAADDVRYVLRYR